MPQINLNTVEELVFKDKKLKDRLVDCVQIFANWHLGYTAALRSIRQQALLDFLEKANATHVAIMEDYFHEPVILDKSLDLKLVRNYIFRVDQLKNELNDLQPKGNCTAYRKGEQVYITYWR